MAYLSIPRFWTQIVLISTMMSFRSYAQDFRKSYAVVVGIDDYSSVHKLHLSYAVKDAHAIADYLKKQGFVVSELYDRQATRHAIEMALHSVAKQVGAEDRVVVFMAGHGTNEPFGDQLWGYFIPYDGVDTFSDLPYTELQDISRQMSSARHQLFIMDACFSGLLMKTRAVPVPPQTPNYIDEVTRRVARQALTAGGERQEVLDTGPNGHSLFTSALLEGLAGAADLNRDGYITFAELESYLIPRASNRFQTPEAGVLPGNGGGEFVFKSPLGASVRVSPAESIPNVVRKRSDKDASSAEQGWTGVAVEPRPKSPQEQDALKRVQQAYASQNWDGTIQAVTYVFANFPETQYKSLLLSMNMNAAQNKGDYAQAISFGEQVIEADPNNIEAHVTLAEDIAQHTRENDVDKEQSLGKAEGYANRALQLLNNTSTAPLGINRDEWPKLSKLWTSQCYDALGQTAGLRNNYADAVKLFQTAVAADPSNVSALARLSRAYLHNRQYEQAIATADSIMNKPGAPNVVKQYAQQTKDEAQKSKH